LLFPIMAPTFHSRVAEDWWVVEKFLDMGWNPNAQNEAGDTLLHVLIRSHPEGMGGRQIRESRMTGGKPPCSWLLHAV